VTLDSELTCRSWTNPFYTSASAPHALCDGRDILIDLSKLSVTNAPKFRSHWHLGKDRYFAFGDGALRARCKQTSSFRLDALSVDHSRDMFASLQMSSDDLAVPDGALVIDEPTLVVTREGDESLNAFHASTDFVNAFMCVQIFDLAPQHGDTRVLLLDNMPANGWLDGLWQGAFAPMHELMHARDLIADGVRHVLLRRPIFVPPGYTSMLYAHNKDTTAKMTDGCSGPVGFLMDFGNFVRSALYGAPHHHHVALLKPVARQHQRNATATATSQHSHAPVLSGQVRVTIVERRTTAHYSKLNRVITNLDSLATAMRAAHPKLLINIVDFARLALPTQVSIVADSHILIGAHGAALAHEFWLMPGSGLLEFMPPEKANWNSFRNMAHWLHLHYRRVALPACAKSCQVDVDAAMKAFDAILFQIIGQ
jgi:Glycosyltransferase 61